MSALSGKRNAELTKKTIETMRSDERSVLFYETMVRKAERQDFIQEPSLSRKLRKVYFSTSMETHQVWQIAHMLQLKTTFGESTLKPLIA